MKNDKVYETLHIASKQLSDGPILEFVKIKYPQISENKTIDTYWIFMIDGTDLWFYPTNFIDSLSGEHVLANYIMINSGIDMKATTRQSIVEPKNGKNDPMNG